MAGEPALLRTYRPVPVSEPPTARPGDDAQAMLGWAQLLHDEVERRLRPSGSTELVAPSWDAMFDDALAQVMGRMLEQRLERLTPEQFLAAYRSVGGDAALLAALDGLVEARAEGAAREQDQLRLAHDAAIAGRLRITELARDETLDIGLFDPTQPQLAAWRFRDNAEKRPLQRVLRVRTTAPEIGAVDVVSDTWTGAVWAERWRTPAAEPLSPARIGSREAGSVELLVELTLCAPLVVVLDAGPELTPPQLVGYVRTLDGRLLLGG